MAITSSFAAIARTAFLAHATSDKESNDDNSYDAQNVFIKVVHVCFSF
jgi:hypothetical protein